MQISRLRRGLGETIRWVVILCALLPGLGGEGGSTRAQDSELFYGLRTEILFPSVVRFMAGVNESAAVIESVSITVRQGARLDEEFTFVPAEHLLADYGSSVELVYDWLLTGGPVPKPFEPVEVVWSVRQTDGRTVETTMLVQFEDSAAGTWKTASDGPVTLHWFNESLAGNALQADVMRAFALLSEHVQQVLPIEFAIYDPTSDLCTTLEEPDGSVRLLVVSLQDGRQYPCSKQGYESLYAAQGIVFLQREQYGYAPLQNAMITALVRETYAPLWGQKAVPAWFEVGLAGMYHLQANNTALQVARAAGRTESLIPLEGLMFDPPENWSTMKRALWEAQSALMVLYLADGWGADAPFELAKQLAEESGDFETLFAAYTGQEVRVFWAEWQRWLYAGAAEDATRWTPYLVTTPTPTPTATATVIVPTATFTAVPSYTPTREFAPTPTPQ